MEADAPSRSGEIDMPGGRESGRAAIWQYGQADSLFLLTTMVVSAEMESDKVATLQAISSTTAIASNDALFVERYADRGR